MPSSRKPEGDFSDSDQQWFDRLSGKPGPYDSERAVREADALRLALDLEHERLTREAAESSDDEDDDEKLAHEWERLQFELKRQGLLGKSQRPRWLWPALGGMAAAVMLSVVLVPLWRDGGEQIYGQPPVLRGAEPVRQVVSATPQAAAEGLLQELQQRGLTARIYQANRSFVVDVNLKVEQLEVARPAFLRHDLAPAPGLNRLVFFSR